MDARLEAVKDSVQHLHLDGEVDEPILQYIQQLSEQAARDGDPNELRETLEACFPGQSTSKVDHAVATLLSQFSGATEQPSSAHEAGSKSGASSSPVVPSVAGTKVPHDFFVAAAAKVTEEGNQPSGQNGPLVQISTGSAPIPRQPASTSPAPDTTQTGVASSALKLNPHACVFVPRQTPAPAQQPAAHNSRGRLREYLLPATVPGSVEHVPGGSDGITDSADSSSVTNTSERADAPASVALVAATHDTGYDRSRDWSFTPAGTQGGGENNADELEWDLTAEETEAQFLQDAGWGWVDARECTGDQAVTILSYWFPSYSVQVLTDMLEANHGSLAKTYAELATLELDITNMSHPALDIPGTKISHEDSVVNAPANTLSTTPPTLDDHHFPSLTSSSPSASHGMAKPRSSSWGGHQGAAKSFAGALQAMPSRSPPTHSWTPSSAPQAQSRPRNISSKPAAVNVPWVTTGEEVAAQYAAAREEARDHARLRNMCFQQATLAFLSGNKALAKELSLRGRHHSDLMKQCHEQASQGIFQARNAHLTSPLSRRDSAKSGPANFVDLHGIHAAEARNMLDNLLAGSKQGRRGGGSQQTLLVCVGTGHHTKVQYARLSQAVEAYLAEKGFTYSYAQPGLIRVVL